MAVAATSPMLTQLDPGRCEVALELIDEHFPVLLVRLAGQIQPQHVLRMIRFFDSNAAIAAAQGQSLVHICDARDVAMPTALVRDMLVDWLSDLPRAKHYAARGQLSARGYVVASEMMVRGIVTSIKWATGLGDNLQVVSTLEQAIAGARADLESAGVEIPQILRNA